MLTSLLRSPLMVLSPLAAIAIIPLACCLSVADDDPREEPVTLMGMLLEWRYPDSKFNGAETTDAAVSGISAIKSKGILTTPDSAEKVMDFYREKLKVDADGKNLGEKEGERITTDRSVLIQGVSGERSKLYVIAINSAKSSTTLVVSRADSDDVTHIAWSNYRQLAP